MLRASTPLTIQGELKFSGPLLGYTRHVRIPAIAAKTLAPYKFYYVQISVVFELASWRIDFG